MNKTIYDIFISYRRDGGGATAGRINDMLAADGYSVSYDVDTLREGRFDKQLLDRIEQCQDFILVVDKNCFVRTIDPATDKQDDWLWQELSFALKLKKNIIPVLLAGTDFPKCLPEDIDSVRKINGPKCVHEYFDEFYKRLRDDFLRAYPRLARSSSVGQKNMACLKLKADIDCIFYLDGEEHTHLKAGVIHKIPLAKGEYELMFISEEDGNDRLEMEFEMPDVDKLQKVKLCDAKNVRLQEVIDTKKNAEEKWLADEKKKMKETEARCFVEERKQAEERQKTEEKIEASTSPQPQKGKTIDPKGKSTALDADEWIIVGASVQGNEHISMTLPCQDSHAYEYIRDGWGIAITSDGAGSAKFSHIGSGASVARAIVHFKDLIEKERWIERGSLPSDIEWMKKSYHVLKTVRNDLELLAKNNKCSIKDLSATIIVVIHSPIGLLSVHIGDGRAGYKDMNGDWHSLITPHKGKEANQTIFIPSDFWNLPFYEMSGVTVPESRIVREQISAFTLMSDGCENSSWLWNQYNELTGKYYDPNMPYSKFFDSLLETLKQFRKVNTPLEERKEKWYNFIKDGNKSFRKETDDKTMILAALYI